MLYTIIPAEEIFEEEEGIRKAITVDGVQLEVEEISPGWGRITRLLSTDPAVFLDPRWQPGGKIRL